MKIALFPWLIAILIGLLFFAIYFKIIIPYLEGSGGGVHSVSNLEMKSDG